MKREIIAVLSAALLLTGCSQGNGESTDKDKGGVITDSAAGISFTVPDSWTVHSGDKVYSNMYKEYSDIYDSADDMKSAFEADGLRYIAYGAANDDGALLTFSSQDLTLYDPNNDKIISLEDYAHTIHDGSVFMYQSSGMTINEGSFTETDIAGGGFLSHFEVLEPTEGEFILGQSELLFQRGDEVFSLLVCYSDEQSKQEALGVFDSVKLTQ